MPPTFDQRTMLYESKVPQGYAYHVYDHLVDKQRVPILVVVPGGHWLEAPHTLLWQRCSNVMKNSSTTRVATR
eukprot:2060072-Amphidinium_carterae.1